MNTEKKPEKAGGRYALGRASIAARLAQASLPGPKLGHPLLCALLPGDGS
jgi:hypothetical protein